MATARFSDQQPLIVHDVVESKLGLPMWLYIEFDRDQFGWAHRNFIGSIELGTRAYDCRCRGGELVCREVTSDPLQP